METAKRTRTLLLIFLICVLAIVIRLFWLQVVQHRFFQERSSQQRMRIINQVANRGDILDRSGNILATSIDTYSVFTQTPSFAYVARKLTRAAAEKLKAEKPREYIIISEKKRFYPKSSLAAQLLGFVGMDNQGLSGIELAQDKYLKGKEGKVVTEGDPSGRELYGALRVIEPGENGMDVILTIDENIQYIAEKAIQEQIRKSAATSGMLIVMHAKTGDILALASKPDFDPNDYKKTGPQRWHPRFLDPYEPGSTFKLITAAAGLEEGAITLDTKLKALDRIEIGGKVIENSHKIKFGGSTISIARMLEESINTATVQVGQKLGSERFYNRIKGFGFGDATNFGMQGESRGIVRYWENWYKPDVGMITFGQGIAVTPLQLVSAVSAFANHGKMVRPTIIKRIESSDGRFMKSFSGDFRGRAVSEKTARQLVELMRGVVVRGSGRRASIEFFSVGGKTGTAQKAAPNGRGYLKGRFIASFIGLAPLTDPQLIALVLIDDPKGSIWGESVCGPVFKEVVEYSLRYLNAKPDML